MNAIIVPTAEVWPAREDLVRLTAAEARRLADLLDAHGKQVVLLANTREVFKGTLAAVYVTEDGPSIEVRSRDSVLYTGAAAPFTVAVLP